MSNATTQAALSPSDIARISEMRVRSMNEASNHAVMVTRLTKLGRLGDAAEAKQRADRADQSANALLVVINAWIEQVKPGFNDLLDSGVSFGQDEK